MVPKPEPHAQAVRILIVEDEVLIRSLLADELREAGLAVIEAGRANEALSYLESVGPVDLVFTDVQMPGSLNGQELARHLRNVFLFIPVILTSGNIGPQSVDGLGVFVPKPYDLRSVVRIVFDTLRLGPVQDLP